MINLAPSVDPAAQEDTWQNILANSVTDPRKLLSLLELPESLLPGALLGDAEFKTRVPYPFLARIKKGCTLDPLLQQVLPVGKECDDVSGFSLDPLSEQNSNPAEGVIHKYQGRMLLIVSGACAINCRFCFRRHFPYTDNQLGRDAFSEAQKYIASDASIKEVIFSGGDPLATSDARLKKMIVALADIPHVETIRIHSRLPIMIPQRVTDDLVGILTGTRLTPVLVTHCNHANELDDSVRQALGKLKTAGVTLLNQSVLLKGVNDSVEALSELSHALFKSSVLPYYLHLLDKVKGAAHFDVDEARARQLVRGVMAQCPGYLVPRLVREIAGKTGKTPVAI